MENHHHCVVCGDVINATARTCSKVSCVKMDERRQVRCHKSGSNYIFTPGKCVENCKGYKMTEVHDDGEAVVECCQVGKKPPEPTYL
jgi:hypothetical protein